MERCFLLGLVVDPQVWCPNWVTACRLCFLFLGSFYSGLDCGATIPGEPVSDEG